MLRHRLVSSTGRKEPRYSCIHHCRRLKASDGRGPAQRGIQAASGNGRGPGTRAGRYFLCGARSRCDEAVRGAGGCGVVAVRRLGKTPPFRGPRGGVVPGSVAEVAYCRLGGLDQWVMIRGESVANPALILLHGGPGWSETGFFRTSTRRLRGASRPSTGISAALASRLTAASLDRR
jgi:pimeloyl-ACP methyl ester carboxylesterase